MGTVVLAALVPARGAAFQLVDGLAVTAIALLFLLHGLRLPRAAVLQGLGHWRLHLVILGVTFLAFPVFVVLLQMLMPGFVAQPLWAGMLFLAALPSTVQSSIAFTSMARGNVAGAGVAAAASRSEEHTSEIQSLMGNSYAVFC